MEGLGERGVLGILLKIFFLSNCVEWMEVLFIKMGKIRIRLKGKRLRIYKCIREVFEIFVSYLSE